MRTEKWDLYIEKHPSVAYTEHTIEGMQSITQFLPIDRYPKMLDVGVANGLETMVLQEIGYDVIGIINGKSNVEYAKKNFPDVRYVETDMHDLPFLSKSFNAIYTNHVFEHSFAPFILLLEFYCVLKSGGRVWIAMPYFHEPKETNIDESINIDKNDVNIYKDIYEGTISHHHPNTLCYNIFKQMFYAAGFKIIHKTKIEKYPYFDTPYLLEKQPLNFLHPDVQAIVNERKRLFG